MGKQVSWLPGLAPGGGARIIDYIIRAKQVSQLAGLSPGGAAGITDTVFSEQNRYRCWQVYHREEAQV